MDAVLLSIERVKRETRKIRHCYLETIGEDTRGQESYDSHDLTSMPYPSNSLDTSHMDNYSLDRVGFEIVFRAPRALKVFKYE